MYLTITNLNCTDSHIHQIIIIIIFFGRTTNNYLHRVDTHELLCDCYHIQCATCQLPSKFLRITPTTPLEKPGKQGAWWGPHRDWLDKKQKGQGVRFPQGHHCVLSVSADTTGFPCPFMYFVSFQPQTFPSRTTGKQTCDQFYIWQSPR